MLLLLEILCQVQHLKLLLQKTLVVQSHGLPRRIYPVNGAGVAAEGPLLEIVADPLGKGDKGIRRARLKPDEGYRADY